MAHAVEGTRCAVHPDQPAVAVCDACGRLACADCQVEVVALEKTFCSASCRGTTAAAGKSGAATDQVLLAGLKRPTVKGWWLWMRSLGVISAHIVPVAFVLAVIWWRMVLRAEAPQSAEDPSDLPFRALFVLTLGLGFVHSAAHAGEIVQFYGMRAARATMSADELGRDWVRLARARL
jgi:hypothetical protein